jgi:energy-coupling factor transporter ATP-binding protein EcfA2
VTRALLLIGAPGAGKSSTLEALGTLLERSGIAYGSIESEQLSMGWPLLPASAWIPSLAAVLTAQRAAGRSLFLIAATPESASDLSALQAAIATDTLVTVCLTAPDSIVASRIDSREPDSWSGKAGLITHARALASAIPTFPGIDTTISTLDRSATSIATELAPLVASR